MGTHVAACAGTAQQPRPKNYGRITACAGTAQRIREINFHEYAHNMRFHANLILVTRGTSSG
jgi:hypothetical protein